MIINRLSILLAERNIRANRLALETGIAQSTLTRITNNRSSQIDYDTLNKICNFFRITPNDFFDYTPFDFEVSHAFEEKELTIFITVSKYNIRENILELTPTIVRKTGAVENRQDVITIEFPKDQKSFYGWLTPKIGDDFDKIISTTIAQKVLDHVMDCMQNIVLDLYRDEFNEFAENYLSILEPNQVQKEAADKEKEIIERLETNLTLF